MTLVATLARETFVKAKPVLLDTDHIDLFDLNHTQTIDDAHLSVLKNVRVFEDGSIFQNGTLIKESLRAQEMYAMYNFSRTLRRRLSYTNIKLPINTNYLPLLDHWSHEYYHWFVDALPRLEFAVQHVKPLTVILSERYKHLEYVTESLKKYGVDVVYIPKKSYVTLPQIYFSTYTAPNEYHRTHLVQSLRSRLRPPSATATKRIYLTRAKARYRKVSNESDVISTLSRHGFTTVDAQDLKWTEQVELFANTQFLVTLHGAGLTNMLFMPETSSLLEIRKNKYGKAKDGTQESSKFDNTYHHLSQALNLRYFSLPSEAPDPDVPCHYSDVIVDTTRLEKLVLQMEAQY